MKRIFQIYLLILIVNPVYSQQSDYLSFLVDSISNETPVLLNLQVDSGFMAVERITISNKGDELYYSIRNGYDSTSISEIRKIIYAKGQWSKPINVFSKNSGAPALSPDNKTIYLQYDHPTHPKGLYANMVSREWEAPSLFIDSLKESHYLQRTNSGKYYYSAKETDNKDSRDVFSVEFTDSGILIKRTGIRDLVKSLDMDFYIARDESYAIITLPLEENQEKFEFYGKRDFFITFKTPDGKWSSPINLGKQINGFSEWKWGQFVTTDNKYFIFSAWSKPVGTYMIRFDDILLELKKKR